MPVGLPEFFDNPAEPRCPVILLCDTSGSMSGAPINATRGLREAQLHRKLAFKFGPCCFQRGRIF